MHYLLIYDLSADYLERRAPLRAAHIGQAREAAARGDLVLAGALTDPPDTAILLFRGDSPAAAEAFARTDPYVRNGLVARWRVREWTTVVGRDAESPLPDPLARIIEPRPPGTRNPEPPNPEPGTRNRNRT